jgi:Cu2+-exporting ATPase
MVTGETLPRPAKVGDKLFAGMINLSAPIELVVSAASDQSLLSEVVALMEKAEQGQAKYVRLADRVSRLYAPVVHGLALVPFIGWMAIGPHIVTHFHWEQALLNAMAVLIITCPCALGLAVPVVQVIASSYLFKKGILLKSGKGLETLAAIDTVVFDKTGTLTFGTPRCTNLAALPKADHPLVLAMAARSHHPLSQALVRALAEKTAEKTAKKTNVCVSADEVEDIAGFGLQMTQDGQTIRLGKGRWVGAPLSDDNAMELWFDNGKDNPVRLTFEDVMRADSAKVVAALKSHGLKTIMLSGDRTKVAETVAEQLGIDEAVGDLNPVDKVTFIEALQTKGHKVLMVGDGLNDAAALSAAYVSMSPSSGVDITQNAAEIVYRGQGLSPVFEVWQVAKRTQTLVIQNLSLSVIYNVLAIPMAVIGLVTPLIAALAMSGSSLMVIGNAFRLKWGIKQALT